MSSSPPSTPNGSRGTSPSSDKYDAQRELEDMMKTPLTASDDALGTGSSESSDDLLPQLSALGTNGNPTSWSTSTLHVESERACRLAIARKLTPYQRDLVDEYVNLTPLSCDMSLFIMQCEILNKLESIITTSRSFVVSKPLSNIARREGLHLPDNYENDTSIVRTISNAVAEELTQACARVKKELTFLHAMYAKDSSPGGFWTGVDNQLHRIRTTAANDAVKITRAFSVYLDKDHTKFGGNSDDTPSLSPLAATWQESVDGIIKNN
ncbi:hypothetical protein BJ165DRAFT_1405294 [Panaeolus papilionaceus]|nr:hypothetical protein BJ165DRAFT_1405294 [Panaeolus papilionaceus]